MYGADYYNGPRQYQTKVRNAQEAHEAIRPTEFRRTPQSLERVLEGDELRIYDLIWKRAIASQMADARMLRTSVEITGTGTDGERALLTASGKAIEFPGYLRAYVEGSDDPAAELDEKETLLPKLAVGDRIQAPDQLDAKFVVAVSRRRAIRPSPPARFTEASLVKRLEEEGIGRPSTYAPTVATIQRRGYVSRQGKALVPSFTAFAVTRLLRDHFGDYVDLGFTAEMEEILDEISNGEKDWLDFIREFYRGDGKHHGLENLVEDKGQEIAYPVIDVCEDPETGLPIRVRIGRYGPFLQLGESSDEGPRASLPDDLAPADLTCEKALALLKAKAEGPRTLGVDPATGQNDLRDAWPVRAYVQLGETPEDKKADKPRRASLGRNFSEDTITLQDALKLLSLPRELGAADDGEVIVANVGRFGPYVKHGNDFRSLEADDDVYTITLARAKELLAQEKKSIRRQRAAAKELRVLGEHPDSRSARAHPRRPLRSVRHRRRDQRVAAEGHRARSADDGRGRGPAGGARGRRERSASPCGEKAGPARIEEGEAARDREVHDDASHMIHIIGGGLAGSEAAWQAAEPRRPGHDSRDASRASDRRPQDRRARRAGVQQLVPRRQAR